MVRDLLDANRIRAGERLPLRLDQCDLGAVAREVVEEPSAIHGERFVLRIDSGVRGVWSAEELRRALWNLGSNAVKYGSAHRRRCLQDTERRRVFGAQRGGGDPSR